MISIVVSSFYFTVKLFIIFLTIACSFIPSSYLTLVYFSSIYSIAISTLHSPTQDYHHSHSLYSLTVTHSFPSLPPSLPFPYLLPTLSFPILHSPSLSFPPLPFHFLPSLPLSISHRPLCLSLSPPRPVYLHGRVDVLEVVLSHLHSASTRHSWYQYADVITELKET